MVRMRLLSEAYCQLKQDDPETAVTICGLRRLVKSGEIPSILVGRKSLINYDLLIQYLHSGTTKHDVGDLENVDGIRKISIN